MILDRGNCTANVAPNVFINGWIAKLCSLIFTESTLIAEQNYPKFLQDLLIEQGTNVNPFVDNQ